MDKLAPDFLEQYDALIFDLDGTLWDSCQTIADAWNYALELDGHSRHISLEDVAGIMGLTFKEIFAKLFPQESAAEQERLGILMELQEEVFLKEQGGFLYPGVAEVLPELSQKRPLFIVSNCQKGYIESFLEFTGLGEFFQDFESFGNTLSPKSVNIQSVCKRNNLQNALYLGDTPKDGRAAHKAGLDFLFVNWGFGLNEQNAPSIDHFTELSPLVLAHETI